ncbi:hypothetical protein ES703_124652 [subsurface metagenome]
MRMSRPGGLGAGPHVFFDLDWPAVCQQKGVMMGTTLGGTFLQPAKERLFLLLHIFLCAFKGVFCMNIYLKV